MSFLFPRLISIARLKTDNDTSTAVGLGGYSGAEASTSSPQGPTVLFTNIAASIFAGTTGRKKEGNLPQDVVTSPTWYISISSVLPQYSVRDRDIITDDEGYRYEVSQNYWTMLGYNLTCIRLEA